MSSPTPATAANAGRTRVSAPTAATASRRVAQPWLWRAQRALSNYLPLLLMAFLAGGTWWLVKNTPLLDGNTEDTAPRHVPDYRMKNFELQRIAADGRLQVQVAGAELRHYPDTDTVEIDTARVRAIAPDGSLAIAEAQRAISNGDGSDLQLIGNVRLRRLAPGAGADAPAQLEVTGPFLEVLSNAEILRSNQPVTIRQRGATLQAQNFEYRHLTGQVSFTGHAQGQIATRAPR